MTTSEKPTGIAAAALWAAAIGLLVLAMSHIGAGVSSAGKEWVHHWGRIWMPGAERIGPYSGKETLAGLAWVLSWIGLHLGLRRRAVDLTLAGFLFLVCVGVATTLLWPPVTESVIHLLKANP